MNKKPRSKKRKLLQVISLFVVLINALIIATDNTYLYSTFLYNFADIDDNKIFESRKIESGKEIPWLLSEKYNQAKMPEYLKAQHEKLNSIAFLIVKNDSIFYEKYWDGYQENFLSNSFSMAKSIVSILTGIALDEGKIKSVDQPVSDFLSEFKENDKNKIKIKHLLNMTSGIDWNESYSNPFSITTQAYYGKNLKKLIGKIKSIEEPGKTFNYLSGNTLILAEVLEKATGQKVSSYASEKLWKPIGASQTAEWSLDKKNGTEKAYCCFYSNARDFARIGSLYLNKGNIANKQIVSEEFVNESLRAVNLPNKDSKNVDYYGYSWWLMKYKNYDIFYARGILGQYIIVIPQKNVIIVRLGKKRGVKQGYHLSDVYTYIDGALEMCGRQ